MADWCWIQTYAPASYFFVDIIKKVLRIINYHRDTRAWGKITAEAQRRGGRKPQRHKGTEEDKPRRRRGAEEENHRDTKARRKIITRL